MTTSNYKTLVVQGNAIFRQLIIRILSNEGFVCDAACDGFEAEQDLEKNMYDVVVTGLILPNKNGYAAVLKVLTLPLHKRPALIVLTTVTDDRITKDLLARGVDGLVHKPVDEKLFAANLRKFMDNRKLARQAHANIGDDRDGTSTRNQPPREDYWNFSEAEITQPRHDHAIKEVKEKQEIPIQAQKDSQSVSSETWFLDHNAATKSGARGRPASAGGEIPTAKPLAETSSNLPSDSTTSSEKGGASKIKATVKPGGVLRPILVEERTSLAVEHDTDEDLEFDDCIHEPEHHTERIVEKTILRPQLVRLITSEKNRSLMIALFCCIFLMLWTALQFYSIYQQNFAIGVLQQLGANVSYESQGFSVDAQRLDVTEIMDKLKDLHPVRSVDLSSSNVSDEELMKLTISKELQKLGLNQTSVSDEGMEHLMELQQLRELHLKETAVTLEKIRQLEKMIPGLNVDHEKK